MNSSKFLTEQTKQNKTLVDVRKFLYKNYIKTVIEDTDATKKRVMFISNRKQSNFDNPLSSEMNGLITTYDELTNEWEIIMIPTTNFNSSKMKMINIEKLYNDKMYNVYKAYDGTIINLYYYNNEWKIATSNGYDVTNLYINQEYTYKNLFNEICLQYPEFNLETLDNTKCYTLCMKYTKIHLFEELSGTNVITLIQSVDLKTFNININDTIGFPTQEIITDITFKNLFNNNKKSVDNYKTYLKNKNNNYQHNYGYILKSVNPSFTQSYSYIYLESELMKNIRRMIYDYRYLPDSIKKDKLYNYDMNILNIIKYILSNSDDYFKKYFPKYSSKYDTIKKFILNDLPEHILNNINNIDISRNSVKFIIQNDTQLPKIDNFYIMNYNVENTNKLTILIYSFLIFNNININCVEGKSILNDVINLTYIHEYYDCLINHT